MKVATRTITMLMIATSLSGCAYWKKKKARPTPVIGERIAVLTSDTDITIDLPTATAPFSLPAPVANAEWAQSGGNAAKSMGQVALGDTLGLAWTVGIGQGAEHGARLLSPPVVAAGNVYTIDTTGTVRAFSAANGAPVWSQRFGKIERGDTASTYGGGVAFADGKIYATNGLGFVAALDAATGAQAWVVKPSGPLRGAPTVADGTVYVTTQDNQIFSLKAADGKINWSNAAALEVAGVFGAASPAVARGTVIAGFSSGELNAYRYENGRLVWQDSLSRTAISTSVASLSDIDASPVVDGNQVFAIGKGGRVVALELTSGQRMWEQAASGNATPWVAGDWLFVVTDDARMVAMSRATGKVRWINQMPKWENPKGRKGAIYYYGPVLAGNRLIVTGTNGSLINIRPDDGSFISQSNVGDSVSLPPVVAGSTLYVLTDKGRLIAYR